LHSSHVLLEAPYNKRNREQRIENKNFNLSEIGAATIEGIKN